MLVAIAYSSFDGRTTSLDDWKVDEGVTQPLHGILGWCWSVWMELEDRRSSCQINFQTNHWRHFVWRNCAENAVAYQHKAVPKSKNHFPTRWVRVLNCGFKHFCGSLCPKLEATQVGCPQQILRTVSLAPFLMLALSHWHLHLNQHCLDDTFPSVTNKHTCTQTPTQLQTNKLSQTPSRVGGSSKCQDSTCVKEKGKWWELYPKKKSRSLQLC